MASPSEALGGPWVSGGINLAMCLHWIRITTSMSCMAKRHSERRTSDFQNSFDNLEA